jgi:hypothetical protein
VDVDAVVRDAVLLHRRHRRRRRTPSFTSNRSTSRVDQPVFAYSLRSHPPAPS